MSGSQCLVDKGVTDYAMRRIVGVFRNPSLTPLWLASFRYTMKETDGNSIEETKNGQVRYLIAILVEIKNGIGRKVKDSVLYFDISLPSKDAPYTHYVFG